MNACSGDEESLAIGQLYFDHYIRACKHIFCLSFVVLKSFNSQNDPVPSSDFSRLSFNTSFDTHKATIKAMLVEGDDLEEGTTPPSIRSLNYHVAIIIGELTDWLPGLVEKAKLLKANGGFEKGADL